MNITVTDIVWGKQPEKGSPIVFFRYDSERKLMYVRCGRIQEVLENSYRIEDQISHKDNLFGILTEDAYTRIRAQEYRKQREKVDKFLI